ncbi:ferric reductase-like transmembrane domain-containing protein [Nocardioides sp. TRM66260-LWL]|uniref:ferric reductase-like transmembrane domain-containing protein n=1 Tax=Nocardioides sp. TRM66260-LWL TaxID=2874478 RepID=UPI001CC337A7|nr:ferric reductase-like transmembrane domain-containing protein [Nocardioides sp. TRM66260-LWL]MBZ5733443.1 ferric reductase-like transmembrane domain-containing protein [Nocardioides sp. TRM66260-LWL]
MMDGPLLWFLNRGTGVVLLTLLSASVVLGVTAIGGRAAGDGGGRLPRFVTASLHRNLALGSVLFLLVHVVTAVVDSYVDIRWWQAFSPVGATYEPLWTGLGALALDLMVAVSVTALLRHRLGARSWRTVHLLSWAAWASGVVHGVMIGTDLRDPSQWTRWALVPTALSVVAVLLALGWRVSAGAGRHRDAVASAPAREPRAAEAVR